MSMVAVIVFVISFVTFSNFCLYSSRSMSAHAASVGFDGEG
jgi:hypothetical protein